MSSLGVDTSPTNGRPSTSSHRLLVAILWRAIRDFVLYKDEDPSLYNPDTAKTKKKRNQIKNERKRAQRDQEIAANAAGWLFWDGEEPTAPDGGYTFRYICDVLDLDHSEIRKWALAMTREKIQAIGEIKEDQEAKPDEDTEEEDE